MAITLETTTLVVTQEERTKQIVISTPKGEDPALTIYRERVSSTADGTILGIESVGVVVRSLSGIVAQSFTVGGVTLTGAQMAAILAGVADQLRQEDMAG